MQPCNKNARGALLLCLFSMFVQNLLQTNFGKVEIRQVTTVTGNGYKHTATLYIPPNATPETPAPAILMAHGSWKAREVMNGYALELSRRGYVVYNYDQYGMGDSEPVDKRSVDSRDALQIVAKLPYVNPEQIGITGHSSGGRVGDMLTKNRIVKTVLLAVLTAIATIGIVFIADYFFNTNFQFWEIMFRSFDADKIRIMLCVLIFFLMFHIPNSIACHSFRYNEVGGRRPWVNTLIDALFNAASIIYIEIVQYSVFFATGQPFWHLASFDRQLGGWLLGTVVIMFVTPWIARKIYKETRNSYLGGILNALVVTVMIVSFTITYLPA